MLKTWENKTIVCLGNNTIDTDTHVRALALKHNIIYRGLLTDVIPLDIGIYQTSLYDVHLGMLLDLSISIDTLIILDQAVESFIDSYDFYRTITVGKSLSESMCVIFENEKYQTTIEDELKSNQSFCILPYIQYTAIDGYHRVCCWSTSKLGKASNKASDVDFLSDDSRNRLKQNMETGILNTDHCQYCINSEKLGHISPRITQTIEWTNRLRLHSMAEIVKIQSPVYYEIRPNNICNLKCRSCEPYYSSAIEVENKTTKIYAESDKILYNSFECIDIEKLEKLYIAGGEPTIIRETHEFLELLITKGQLTKEIQINTNAVLLLPKFKQLITKLSNVKFEISIDGYNKCNDYISSNSKWDSIIQNVDYLYNAGHDISFNIVVSIYSLTSLSELMEYLYNRYKTIIHLSFAIISDIVDISPYQFPDKETVLKKLKGITTLDVYLNDFTVQSKIDELIDYFETKHTVDLPKLQEFFNYNDKLDTSRNIKLIDYIPELEECRKYLTKQI